ncbi:hypothetical protein M3182_16095 [Mesobacillus maritimus]|uniref:hypothetical protein n=1 Tax=Mesobacillus maritimus TaxID=1643336 RepID=UPI00203C09A8|nr:hypothetical protein [Mesobacillus maritimus]MCM3587261.1 hypothetical protein [Mesobacillus maritimus]MCM3667826.1 hypothetical protein [Mesobacillus maritimus]
MPKAPNRFKRLSADIPEQLYKDFAKKCIEEGVSKKEFIMSLLEKELYKGYSTKNEDFYRKEV